MKLKATFFKFVPNVIILRTGMGSRGSDGQGCRCGHMEMDVRSWVWTYINMSVGSKSSNTKRRFPTNTCPVFLFLSYFKLKFMSYYNLQLRRWKDHVLFDMYLLQSITDYACLLYKHAIIFRCFIKWVQFRTTYCNVPIVVMNSNRVPWLK